MQTELSYWIHIIFIAIEFLADLVSGSAYFGAVFYRLQLFLDVLWGTVPPHDITEGVQYREGSSYRLQSHRMGFVHMFSFEPY